MGIFSRITHRFAAAGVAAALLLGPGLPSAAHAAQPVVSSAASSSARQGDGLVIDQQWVQKNVTIKAGPCEAGYYRFMYASPDSVCMSMYIPAGVYKQLQEHGYTAHVQMKRTRLLDGKEIAVDYSREGRIERQNDKEVVIGTAQFVGKENLLEKIGRYQDKTEVEVKFERSLPGGQQYKLGLHFKMMTVYPSAEALKKYRQEYPHPSVLHMRVINFTVLPINDEDANSDVDSVFAKDDDTFFRWRSVFDHAKAFDVTWEQQWPKGQVNPTPTPKPIDPPKPAPEPKPTNPPVPAPTPQPSTPTTPSVNSPFTDVAADNPFVDDIAWLKQQGITAGWSDGTFRPTDGIERQAMAAFLYRAAGEPNVQLPKQSPFTDVNPNDPFYKEIVWLKQQGITAGWSDGTFRPTDGIERQAMAAFLYRAAGKPKVQLPKQSPFADVKPSDPFYKEIVWAYQRGITTGWPDGTFRPHDQIERQAMAAFLHRYSKK